MTDLTFSSGFYADNPSMLDQPVIADQLDHHQAVNVDVHLC